MRSGPTPNRFFLWHTEQMAPMGKFCVREQRPFASTHPKRKFCIHYLKKTHTQNSCFCPAKLSVRIFQPEGEKGGLGPPTHQSPDATLAPPSGHDRRRRSGGLPFGAAPRGAPLSVLILGKEGRDVVWGGGWGNAHKSLDTLLTPPSPAPLQRLGRVVRGRPLVLLFIYL